MANGSMLKVLRQMATREPGGSCATCSLASTCRGGCPGRVLAVHGSLGRRNPRFPMPGCLLRLHPSKQSGRDQYGENKIIETQATN
jgi:hypothetical protein